MAAAVASLGVYLLHVTGAYYRFARRRVPSLRGGPAVTAALWEKTLALTGLEAPAL